MRRNHHFACRNQDFVGPRTGTRPPGPGYSRNWGLAGLEPRTRGLALGTRGPEPRFRVPQPRTGGPGTADSRGWSWDSPDWDRGLAGLDLGTRWTGTGISRAGTANSRGWGWGLAGLGRVVRGRVWQGREGCSVHGCGQAAHPGSSRPDLSTTVLRNAGPSSVNGTDPAFRRRRGRLPGLPSHPANPSLEPELPDPEPRTRVLEPRSHVLEPRFRGLGRELAGWGADSGGVR
jgi:hypothetical protein